MSDYTYNGFTTGQKVRVKATGLIRTVGYPGPRGIPGRVYVSDGAYAGQHYATSEIEVVA